MDVRPIAKLIGGNPRPGARRREDYLEELRGSEPVSHGEPHGATHGPLLPSRNRPTCGGSHVGMTSATSCPVGISQWGTNILYIAAVDTAGNISQTYQYDFYVPWKRSYADAGAHAPVVGCRISVGWCPTTYGQAVHQAARCVSGIRQTTSCVARYPRPLTCSPSRTCLSESRSIGCCRSAFRQSGLRKPSSQCRDQCRSPLAHFPSIAFGHGDFTWRSKVAFGMLTATA